MSTCPDCGQPMRRFTNPDREVCENTGKSWHMQIGSEKAGKEKTASKLRGKRRK